MVLLSDSLIVQLALTHTLNSSWRGLLALIQATSVSSHSDAERVVMVHVSCIWSASRNDNLNGSNCPTYCTSGQLLDCKLQNISCTLI